MNSIKIYFSTWHFKNSQQFVNSFIKLTPNCLGKWKNIEYTLDKNEADYIVVFDGTKEDIDFSKTLYFGCHPKGPSNSYKDFKNNNCLAAFPLSHYLNPGEVWIDYTYDELKVLQPPTKKYDLACIVTYQDSKKTYRDRIEFLHQFMPNYFNCHLYGRKSERFLSDPILKNHYKGFLGYDGYDQFAGEHLSGKNILLDYRYSLEFDQGPTTNYICERFYDAMLLWTMPIYFGSINVEKYFPSDSFRYVNITLENPIDIMNEVDRIIEIVSSKFYEKNIEAMSKARELILEKYQVWAMVHKIVNNIDYYVNKWEEIRK